MISIIFKWLGDLSLIDTEDNPVPFYYSLSKVKEMVEGTYLLILSKPDDFDVFESMLEPQADVFVIGTYNQNGSQFLWGNEISRNHSQNKYHTNLVGSVNFTYTTDEEGNEIVDEIIITPYTLEQSEDVQVSLPMGWGKRILG